MAAPLELLAHPKAAAEYLGKRLFDGSLALLLGAGTSKPLGLPSFEELLRAGFAYIKEPPCKGSDLELGATMLGAACERKGIQLADVIRECLYPKGGLSPSDLMKSTRMGALGAMLMGSRRGTVSEVFTFNYDSVLEEYLLLHGYVVRIITKVPSLSGSEDVTIFHPHGYLPSKTGPGAASHKITFTKESILQMLGDPNHPWVGLIRALVRSKVVLLLGIDEKTAIGNSLGPIFAHEAEQLKADRPSAFWVAKGGAKDAFRTVMLNANVVPVAVSSHEQVDELLLAICRRAAECMVR